MKRVSFAQLMRDHIDSLPYGAVFSPATFFCMPKTVLENKYCCITCKVLYNIQGKGQNCPMCNSPLKPALSQ